MSKFGRKVRRNGQRDAFQKKHRLARNPSGEGRKLWVERPSGPKHGGPHTADQLIDLPPEDS